MSDSILPSATQQTVARIDSITTHAVSNANSTITRLENLLNNSTDPTTKTVLAPADIIGAANGRLNALPAVIDALKAFVNTAVPGTYPVSATTQTPVAGS